MEDLREQAELMLKRTAYAIFLDEVVDEIDAYVLEGSGQHKKRIPLLRELAMWSLDLVDAPILLPEVVSSFTKRSKPFRENGGARDMAACALYAEVVLGLPRAKAAALTSKAKPNDLATIERIARAASLNLDRQVRALSKRLRYVVERHFEEMVIDIDLRAVEDMFLPAIEALGPKPHSKRGKFKETYGLCFGSRREVERSGGHVRRIFHVSRIVTQIHARATADAVWPNDHSESVHLSLAHEFFEHVDLLGDYHSHPYKTVAELKAAPGWEPSKHDEAHFESWARKKIDAGHGPRFFMIAAMARGKRGRRRAEYRAGAKNIIHMCIGDVHVYLSAWRFTPDGHYDQKVELRIPWLERRA